MQGNMLSSVCATVWTPMQCDVKEHRLSVHHQHKAGIGSRGAGRWRPRATPQNRQLGNAPASGVCLKLRLHRVQHHDDTALHSWKVTGQRATRCVIS